MGNFSAGLSRLKGIFGAELPFLRSVDTVRTAKRQVLGNLPNDILHAAILGNPSSKAASIKGIQRSFDKAASTIERGTSSLRSNVYSKIPNNIEGFRIFKAGSAAVIDAEKELEVIIKAEEVLLKELKQYLPDVENVIFSKVGWGQFSTVYKCEILGKNGEKLFSDKAIKVFYKESPFKPANDKRRDILKNCSDEELSQAFPKLNIERERSMANIPDTDMFTVPANGPYHEANIAEYIKKRAGKKVLPEDGLVIPDMYNLGETPYALMPFIPEGFKANKLFDFKKLGLMHTDFRHNTANQKGSCCLDIGGIIKM